MRWLHISRQKRGHWLSGESEAHSLRLAAPVDPGPILILEVSGLSEAKALVASPASLSSRPDPNRGDRLAPS
jgi:hypothetical protein